MQEPLPQALALPQQEVLEPPGVVGAPARAPSAARRQLLLAVGPTGYFRRRPVRAQGLGELMLDRLVERLLGFSLWSPEYSREKLCTCRKLRRHSPRGR